MEQQVEHHMEATMYLGLGFRGYPLKSLQGEKGFSGIP